MEKSKLIRQLYSRLHSRADTAENLRCFSFFDLLVARSMCTQYTRNGKVCTEFLARRWKKPRRLIYNFLFSAATIHLVQRVYTKIEGILVAPARHGGIQDGGTHTPIHTFQLSVHPRERRDLSINLRAIHTNRKRVSRLGYKLKVEWVRKQTQQTSHRKNDVPSAKKQMHIDCWLLFSFISLCLVYISACVYVCALLRLAINDLWNWCFIVRKASHGWWRPLRLNLWICMLRLFVRGLLSLVARARLLVNY